MCNQGLSIMLELFYIFIYTSGQLQKYHCFQSIALFQTKSIWQMLDKFCSLVSQGFTFISDHSAPHNFHLVSMQEVLFPFCEVSVQHIYRRPWFTSIHRPSNPVSLFINHSLALLYICGFMFVYLVLIKNTDMLSYAVEHSILYILNISILSLSL